MQNNKPWDARLAYWLVYPLRNTPITPNYLTTLRLLFGLLATYGLAHGDYLSTNLGALAFVVSHFLDHTDGELARLTGHSTRFGHIYDLVTDGMVNALMFVGIGIGLSMNGLGHWGWIMGIIAGLSVATTFHMVNIIIEVLERDLLSQSRDGATGNLTQKIYEMERDAAPQPQAWGFEIEDILYLLPVVTLFDGLYVFLLIAAIGAPIFAIRTYFEYRKIKSRLKG